LRRQGAAVVWIEVDVVSGKETGHRRQGTIDCTDGNEDPSPPGDVGAQLDTVFTTQLRVISRAAFGY
jgi:hypothetical protein